MKGFPRRASNPLITLLVGLLVATLIPGSSLASPSPELPSSTCWRSAFCTPAGNCWFATWDGIALRTYGGAWEAFSPSNSPIAQNYCHDVRVDGSGLVWTAHHGNGVSLLDHNGTPANKADDTWLNFTSADGLLANRVHSIEFAPDGKVWFGTDDGISILDHKGTPFNKVDDSWTSYAGGVGGLVVGPVNSILFDGQGCVWAGTDFGLSRNCGGWLELSWSGVPGCLQCCWTWPAFVWEIVEDQSGQVWIADGLCGASRWDGSSWTVYDVEDPNGLPPPSGSPLNPGAMSLAVDPHNNLWIGMGSQGVVRLDGFGEMTHFTTTDPWLGFNDEIEGAEFDPSGKGWFASCGLTGSYSLYTMPGSSTTLVTPGGGGDVFSPDHRVKASFPPGAVGSNTVVTLTPASSPPLGDLLALYLMDLSAVEEGTSNPVTSFSQPYSLEVLYSEAHRGVISESTLGIHAWDGLAWALEPGSIVDPVANRVSALVDHMTYFGVLGEAWRLYLPLILR